MKIKGVSEDTIRAVANDLNFKLLNERKEGNYFCFVLRMKFNIGRGGYKKATPEALKYRKRGFRAVSVGSESFGGNGAVCYHGHKRFMELLFKINPDAVIRTAKATYLGEADFKSKAPNVGYEIVGSMFMPVAYDESCDCYW